MGFEVFDLADVESAPPAAMVRVEAEGVRLNRRAYALIGVGTRSVQLLFDSEQRMVQVRAAELTAPGTSVFPVEAVRSMDWPALVRESVFVQRCQITPGEYPAVAKLGRVTFPVGQPLPRDQATTLDREPDGFGWPVDRGAVRP